MKRARILVLALVPFACAAVAGCSSGSEEAPLPDQPFTVVEAPAGIVIRRFNETDGAHPKVTDRVEVHYHGTFVDGTVFDSSVNRGKPAVFPLNGVIPCWTEAVTRLRVGEKAQIVCPPDTAYGEAGIPGRMPPNATLTFEVELLAIQ